MVTVGGYIKLFGYSFFLYMNSNRLKVRVKLEKMNSVNCEGLGFVLIKPGPGLGLARVFNFKTLMGLGLLECVSGSKFF